MGGNRFESKVELNTIPVWVKAGSFVPITSPINNTELYTGAEVAIHYYHHPQVMNGKGQWYEDDGKDRNAIEEQRYSLFKFASAVNAKKLRITIEKQGNGYVSEPEKRNLNWIIHNIKKKPSKVILDGQKIMARDNHSLSDSEVHSFQFNSQNSELVINTPWSKTRNKMTIEVQLGE